MCDPVSCRPAPLPSLDSHPFPRILQWTLVFRQRAPEVVTDKGALSINPRDPQKALFSRLGDLEHFRDPSHGDFTFRLYWPGREMSAVWRQRSNPVESSSVQDFAMMHTCCDRSVSLCTHFATHVITQSLTSTASSAAPELTRPSTNTHDHPLALTSRGSF